MRTTAHRPVLQPNRNRIWRGRCKSQTMTDQIAEAIWDQVEPEGVGVVVEAYHLCMMMRGVQKQNSKTITSAMRGSFLEDQMTRDEFLRLCMTDHNPLSQ